MNDMSRRILPPGGVPDTPARPKGLRTGLFGVLDIGSTKIACLIGRTESDGAIRVLGVGWQKGRGVRQGGIADLEEAERAIRACVGQAEEMADTRLRSVTVNLNCGQPESRRFNVQWQVGGRAVNDQDIRKIMIEGRTRAISEGRETIHAIPLGFGVDELAGVGDPRLLHCDTLSARLHVIDSHAAALRNLAACIARCDLDIAEMVSAPMAAGLSTLVEDERILGATVIDMGGGTTGLAVFADGQVIHTAQLPIGGQHITNDIARLLSTTVAHAERLKTLVRQLPLSSPDDEREMLPVPAGRRGGASDRPNVPRSMVVSIIRPRLEEIFEIVKDRLDSCRPRPRMAGSPGRVDRRRLSAGRGA